MLEAPATRPPGAGRPRDAVTTWLVALGLAALVAAVYWGVGEHGFINSDDPRYVYQNPRVRAGLTMDGVRWAFTTFHAANWHPLTWLSHMLDVDLFGVDPGWHHRVNVLLHAINAVLLFVLLRSASGAIWRAALVAALFAVHPLHVESVAWVAERKDVLSTLFAFLAMIAYVRWVRRRTPSRYALVAVALALGLLSKPMLVTLPLVLLLLDWWPLGRFADGFRPSAAPLVREKLPLLALSAASCAVTYVAQARGGAVSSVQGLPLGIRLANAALSYVGYLAKAFWPSRLAAVYPHPALTSGGMPAASVVASVLLLAGITSLVLWQARRRPWLVTGWLWYLVTLVPVIGIVQVGMQAMADRYTYVPLTGIFVALAWSVPDVAAARRLRVGLVGAAAILVLVASGVARRQVGYWRDDFTLLGHALAVTEENSVAWRNLGAAYVDTRQYAPAIPALRESLRLVPSDPKAWINLGIAFASLGEDSEAVSSFHEAIRLDPADAFAWYNLGVAHAKQGRWDRAVEIEERLRRTNPDLAHQLWTRLRRAGVLP